jgi:phthiodiolone/phenolphthiodiolone dimycocerosates ketoreductase
MLLTAELGDGWIPTASMGPEGYRENLKKIREHAIKSGRSSEEIEAALFAYIVVEDSYEEARKKIDLPGRVIALLSPFRRRFLEKSGIDEEELGFPHLMEFAFNQESISKLLEWAKRIPFEVVEDRYIFGSPDDVIDRLSRFAEAGAQHFVLTPLVQHKHYLDTVRRIAEKVMPYFRE